VPPGTDLNEILVPLFKKLKFKPEMGAILEITLRELWLNKLKDLNVGITDTAKQEIELRNECDQILEKIDMLSN